MKKPFPWVSWLVIVIISIPFFYLARIYPSLPKTIPIHFDMNGKPNGFGDKDTIWFTVTLLSVVSAGAFFLMKNLPRIDPKKTAGQSPELYGKIALTLVIFLSALNILIIYSTVGGSISINKVMLPLLGLLFLVLGNYMHSIKPNYFVGFRTPWALENEDNWRKTHQLVGKLWVPGGLLITIATLFLPAVPGFIAFMTIVVLMTAIPAIFSYRYFKKQQQSS